MEFCWGMSPTFGKTDDSLSIYDIERKRFRMTVWEEDGVLRVIFNEPVVVVTEEEDLIAFQKKPPRIDIGVIPPMGK